MSSTGCGCAPPGQTAPGEALWMGLPLAEPNPKPQPCDACSSDDEDVTERVERLWSSRARREREQRDRAIGESLLNRAARDAEWGGWCPDQNDPDCPGLEPLPREIADALRKIRAERERWVRDYDQRLAEAEYRTWHPEEDIARERAELWWAGEEQGEANHDTQPQWRRVPKVDGGTNKDLATANSNNAIGLPYTTQRNSAAFELLPIVSKPQMPNMPVALLGAIEPMRSTRTPEIEKPGPMLPLQQTLTHVNPIIEEPSIQMPYFHCDGWREPYHAAPLLDPGVHKHLTSCETDADTGFRLAVTSVATVAMPNGKTRMYFFDGKFKNNLDSRLSSSDYPPFASLLSNRREIYKFTDAGAMSSDIEAFWRSSRTPGAQVTSLHFCRDLIGFLDSENGADYPVYTPIVVDTSSGCDFTTKSAIWYTWYWNNMGVPQSHSSSGAALSGPRTGRAGWRSTVIPCGAASVVYESHAVLRIEVDGRDYYLMLAVRCDGRGRSGAGRDAVASEECHICAPVAEDPCLNDPVPTTDLVFFVSPDGTFQSGTLGPFGVLRTPPDWQDEDWIGVPTAFVSPDERFVFIYVHPQRPVTEPDAEDDEAGKNNNDSTYVKPSKGLYGMMAARMDDLRAALSVLLEGQQVQLAPSSYVELHPGLSIAEVEDMLEQGRQLFAPLFLPLGQISVCGVGSSATGGYHTLWVDEHFVYHNNRLTLYCTLTTGIRPEEKELESIIRCPAEALYDPDALEDVLAGRPLNWSFGEHPLEKMSRSFLQFTFSDCVTVEAEDLDDWATLLPPRKEVNDPAVYDLQSADGLTTSVMLFHCAAAGGLMVQLTENSLSGKGACNVGV